MRRISIARAGPPLAHGLSLAAAPVFATMALLTWASGATDPLCGGGSALRGMVPMYLLMGLFHATPWLKLVAGGRSRVSRA